MRARLLLAAAIVLIALLIPGRAAAFGVNDVLKLERQHAPDSLIVQRIEQARHPIRVHAKDFRRLEKAGTSDQVMSALADTEVLREGTPNRGVPPVYVHYPYDPLPYQAFGYAVGYTFHLKNW